MKFQNCILIDFVTDGWTHTSTDKVKAICHFNFSKVGGIKSATRGWNATILGAPPRNFN